MTIWAIHMSFKVFLIFYHKSEYAIVFLILENMQKHTSFMFVPCLLKNI